MKIASLSSAVFLLSATMALALPQSTTLPDAPQPNAQAQNPAAPVKQAPPANAKKSPQPKTQAEYDAYKAAASLTDPAKLEAAATDFAQKFPDSELRSILFQQAMGLYQQADNPSKTLEMARAALKYDPGNAVALLTAAQMLAERTHDNDLDRDDRLAEADADARSALQNIGDIAPPTNMTPEQFAAALAELRGTAHEVLATVAFKKQDYLAAIRGVRPCGFRGEGAHRRRSLAAPLRCATIRAETTPRLRPSRRKPSTPPSPAVRFVN